MVRYLPNFLTILRLIAVPIVGNAIRQHDFRLAIILIFLAGWTDAIDGYLARHFKWTTRLGSYLDPIADKSMLVCVYVMLGVENVIPRWLVALVLGRDLLILGMVAGAFLFTRIRSFPPSVWGKLSTFVQGLTALVAMGWRAFSSDSHTTALYLFVLAAAVTVWSGVDYGWKGIRMLRDEV